MPIRNKVGGSSAKPSTRSVSRAFNKTVPAKVEEDDKITLDEIIEKHNLPETNAKVSSLNVIVEKSYTTKVSDTDYAKIMYTVTLPFNPSAKDVEEAARAIDIASDLVEMKLVNELDRITGKK